MREGKGRAGGSCVVSKAATRERVALYGLGGDYFRSRREYRAQRWSDPLVTADGDVVPAHQPHCENRGDAGEDVRRSEQDAEHRWVHTEPQVKPVGG